MDSIRPINLRKHPGPAAHASNLFLFFLKKRTASNEDKTIPEPTSPPPPPRRRPTRAALGGMSAVRPDPDTAPATAARPPRAVRLPQLQAAAQICRRSGPRRHRLHHLLRHRPGPRGAIPARPLRRRIPAAGRGRGKVPARTAAATRSTTRTEGNYAGLFSNADYDVATNTMTAWL